MANVKHNVLTAAKVKHLTAPGTYVDGEGLTLRVSDAGAKSWVQRLTVEGKRRNVGLGGYPAVGLAEARRMAGENRRAVQEGSDPIEDKRAALEERKALAAIPTFANLASTVIELRRPTWSSDRHAKQWTESLTNHAFPVIGDKRVDTITTADTLAVLLPIWTSKPETATRTRQRMETVFDFAVVQGWRSDNPANGSMAKALPRRPRQKQHHPALAYVDVPAAVAAVRESAADTTTKLAFEFLVLTAARTGEVRGMTWDEVDLETATWTVPSDRMKARREHRVPLSGRALEIRQEARRLDKGNGLVFPSKRSGEMLSNMAFEMLLRRLGIAAVPHGFRSSFRDWLAECTGASWAVAESALAHGSGERASLGYHRTDYFEQRKPLMDQWADFLARVEVARPRTA